MFGVTFDGWYEIVPSFNSIVYNFSFIELHK
jgi:hypothetical protein